jgi:hypothetical protein
MRRPSESEREIKAELRREAAEQEATWQQADADRADEPAAPRLTAMGEDDL